MRNWAEKSGGTVDSAAAPPWWTWVAAVLLFLIPALNLVVRHGTSVCYLLLAVLSIGVAIANRKSGEYFAPLRRYPWFSVGMLALLIGVVVQQIVFRFWLPRQFDTLLRLALGVPVFLMLCRMPFRSLRALGWGCAMGAIVVGITAILDRPAHGWNAIDRFRNSFTNPLPLGNTVLLLAFLAVVVAGWDQKSGGTASGGTASGGTAFGTASRTTEPGGTASGRAAFVLRAVAMLLGLYGIYATGARSALIVVPVFLVLFLAQQGWLSSWKKNAIAVAIMIVAGAGLYSTDYGRNRITDIESNLTAFRHGDENTAIGFRLQYWQASWKLFEAHPIYGVGRGRIADGIFDLIRRHRANPEAAGEYKHSEFFTTIAGMGLIGLACLLLFYFGIAVHFWRNLRAQDAVVRAAAYGGMAIFLATVLDGLTNDVLALVMTCDLLAALSATMLAMIEVRRRENVA